MPVTPSLLLRYRKTLIAVVAIGAACGTVVAANTFLGGKAADPLPTVAVTRGDIESTVTSLGKLKPKDYVDVGTQVSGQLKKIGVEIGDRIAKGELIAVIDSTVYETKIRTDRANLDNLQAQLRQQQAEAGLARQQLTRNQDLLKEGAISQGTVDENKSADLVALARVAATRAQIKAAQAALDGDLANLGYTKIYSPMSGTVVSQTSLQGQTVNALQSAPVIVRVANLETMTVWAQVAEADIVKIKPGASAYFTTLGNTEKRWTGVVRKVMPSPETINDVVLFNVLVDVDNREKVLMSDMTVQIFFVLEAAKGVPLAPLAALRNTNAKDGRSYEAKVVTEGGIVTRAVRTGVANRSMASVVSGLEVGDKLVTAASANAKKPAGDKPGAPGMGPRL